MNFREFHKEKEIHTDTITVYKKIRRKGNGVLTPPFIKKTMEYKLGEWYEAEYVPTKEFAPNFGFHCCLQPYAPHIFSHLKDGTERVWVECEVRNYILVRRPEKQGGMWCLAEYMKPVRILTDEEVEEKVNRERKEVV